MITPGHFTTLGQSIEARFNQERAQKDKYKQALELILKHSECGYSRMIADNALTVISGQKAV